MSDFEYEGQGVFYREVSGNRRVYLYPLFGGRQRIAITAPDFWMSFDDVW